MRKYVIGFIVGVFLTLPATIFAEEISSVGKRIAAEFPVILDGKELPVKAVAFEGTSYAPVRVIAEHLGLDVDFKDNQVILSSKATTDGGGLVETTYNGIKAITINGDTYFNLKDYSGIFDPIGWRYEKETHKVQLVEYEAVGSSVVKKKFLEVDLNDPETHVIHQGQTYVSIEYYREPSDFEAAE